MNPINESDLYGIRVKPTNQDSLRIDKLINLIQAHFIEWDPSNPKFQELARKFYLEWDNNDYKELAVMLWYELNRSEQDPKLVKRLKERLVKPPRLNIFVVMKDDSDPVMSGISGALKAAQDSEWASIYIDSNPQLSGDYLGRFNFNNGILVNVNFTDSLVDYKKFNQIPKVKELSLTNLKGLRTFKNMLNHVIKSGLQDFNPSIN